MTSNRQNATFNQVHLRRLTPWSIGCPLRALLTRAIPRQVSSLEAPRRAAGGARLEAERRSLDLERELRPGRGSDASLDERDHLV